MYEMDYAYKFQMFLMFLAASCLTVTALGFDSGGSCEPRSARRGRAQILASIPCDLTKQAYCNLPGASYPWHAVRRFVHENQGLMKRMYGDVRHLAVLKTEFEENFIEEDLPKKQARDMKIDKKNRRTDIQEPHFRLQSTTSKTTSTTPSPVNNTTKADFELETNLVLNSSSEIVDEAQTTEIVPDITTFDDIVEENFKSTATTMEGQLFQDTMKQTPPTANVRGINACPVKEEVVAPFWANNTRGEVLALLNLYPFEQYVHWEKCTSEHKQMFCREGCRCEQQFSLHRLLAYDPHNECRGIFSDWFRFPSCCICKCYDIPFDYRITSRSPRDLGKQLFEQAQEEVRKAMYEHSVDVQWYRPKEYDEFDEFFDGGREGSEDVVFSE